MRITRLTKIQVERVLAGDDVLGKRQRAPIRFPNEPERRLALYEWTQDFLHSTGPRLTIRQRTAFIRKLANFLIRGGGKLGDEDLAITWFRHRPELLTTNLSFAGAARLAMEVERRARNDAETALFRAMNRDCTRPCGAPPVVGRAGGFSLEQLTHPRHIGDVGAEAGNCLAAIQDDGLLTPNPHYWNDVKYQLIRLFALRHGRDLCLVFSVSGDGISEWDPLREPDGMLPALNSILSRMNIAPVCFHHSGHHNENPHRRNRNWDLAFFTGDLARW